MSVDASLLNDVAKVLPYRMDILAEEPSVWGDRISVTIDSQYNFGSVAALTPPWLSIESFNDETGWAEFTINNERHARNNVEKIKNEVLEQDGVGL